MTILVTSPNYDDTTGYLYDYTKELINFAQSKGKKIFNLEMPRLKRKEFESMIAQHNPKLVLLNGHGDESTIYGDKISGNEEPLVKENENHAVLNNKLIYARSCWSAQSLGKSIVKNGGCFIGYITPFSFWIDTRWSTNPLRDETAKLFLSPSNELSKSLIKGNTANESAKKFEELSKKTMLRLLSERSEPGTMQKIESLWTNMVGQKVIGEGNMCYS